SKPIRPIPPCSRRCMAPATCSTAMRAAESLPPGELEAELERLRPLLAAALDAVIVTDAGGCVLEFNPAAERIFGRARAAALGQPIGDLIVPRHLRGAHEAGMARYAG